MRKWNGCMQLSFMRQIDDLRKLELKHFDLFIIIKIREMFDHELIRFDFL